SSIVGVWAKGEAGTGQSFQQSVLGTALPMGGMGIPIGYVEPDARKALIGQMQDDVAYQVAFSKVKKDRADGRLTYTYDVSLQPVAFAAFIKRFAKDVGVHTLDQLDPNSYKGQQAIKLQVAIDARAHRIIRIAAPGTDYVQTYSAYDVPVTQELPAQTISVRQLQERLAKLQ